MLGKWVEVEYHNGRIFSGFVNEETAETIQFYDEEFEMNIKILKEGYNGGIAGFYVLDDETDELVLQ